jgi:hypothetical protein
MRNLALKALALTSNNTRYLISRSNSTTKPIFFRVSNALFADNLSTRASLDSYLFKLFRMPIN